MCGGTAPFLSAQVFPGELMKCGSAKLFSAALLCLLSLAAHAQAYPSKPMRLVVGTGVGTAVDIVSRVMVERMGAMLGAAIVVENRAGATGTMGAQEVLRQPADGHTLMTLFMPMAAVPAIYPKLPFDLLRDFDAIGQSAWSYHVLVVHPSVRAGSVKELVALLKSKPGQLNFASDGPGTPAHLAGALFLLETGTRALHVPYVQLTQAIGDVLSGQNHYMFVATPPVVSHITGGKLRALAVTGQERIPALKDVPTMVEAGMSNFVVRDWQGFVARRGTPQEVVGRLNATVQKALESAPVREAFSRLGADPAGGSPEAFKQLITSEVARWGKVARAANIKAQ
jgi:tripartite-type tricarboxylate transporter receptor subunit TctC